MWCWKPGCKVQSAGGKAQGEICEGRERVLGVRARVDGAARIGGKLEGEDGAQGRGRCTGARAVHRGEGGAQGRGVVHLAERGAAEVDHGERLGRGGGGGERGAEARLRALPGGLGTVQLDSRAAGRCDLREPLQRHAVAPDLSEGGVWR